MPTLLLTRTSQENQRVGEYFQQRGFQVLAAPMIELLPIPPSYSMLQHWVAEAAAEADSAILLTSITATSQWLRLLPDLPVEATRLRYLIVGERSAGLLRQHYPSCQIVSIAASATELLRHIQPPPATILYPCSTQRRDELVVGLRSGGAEVVELPIYQPQLPANAAHQLRDALLAANSPLCIAFFSPSAVVNFISLQPKLPRGAIFAAVGSTTAEALRDHGITEVIVPAQPNPAMLADAILEVIQQ
ncbi:MAG: uroporphyrinogen-III synthase [Armatimonadetes bacterium]|nr:uroporphyrinogen-III synthase [Armatimonadota bacterium]